MDGGSDQGGVLLGDDLAHSLGLKQMSSTGVTGCSSFAESQPGRGYCLDGVVDNDHDANMLSVQIGGRAPTNVDEQLFNLDQQLDAVPDGARYDAQRAQLGSEIMQLEKNRGG